MSNEVLFKKVSSLSDVSNCSENQIVFCEETGEVYTHSTRYGAPTISEIGDDNPNGNITMIPSSSVSANSISPINFSEESNNEPVSLSLDMPSDSIQYSAGDIVLDSNDSAIGVAINSNTMISLSDMGVYEWGLVDVEVSSGKYGTLSEAILDKSGTENTNSLKAAGVSVFRGIPSDGWYVPALGEFDDMYESFGVIQSSLEKYGTKLLTSYYWSSTSGTNPKSAWAYNMETGEGQLGYRTSKLAIRLFKKI